MSEGNEKKTPGFWSTLPGVLTALAAVITGVGGLITVLYKTGILGPEKEPTSADDVGASRPAEEKERPNVPEREPTSPGDVGASRPADEEERMPSLAVPQDGSTVSQPYVQPWVFRWDAPSGHSNVRQYHLRVLGATAAYPLVDDMMNGTERTISRQCTYIIDRNLLGWKWQVRAQFQDGTWGPWAGPSTFDVSPFNKDLFCQRCPDANVCRR